MLLRVRLGLLHMRLRSLCVGLGLLRVWPRLLWVRLGLLRVSLLRVRELVHLLVHRACCCGEDACTRVCGCGFDGGADVTGMFASRRCSTSSNRLTASNSALRSSKSALMLGAELLGAASRIAPRRR